MPRFFLFLLISSLGMTSAWAANLTATFCDATPFQTLGGPVRITAAVAPTTTSGTPTGTVAFVEGSTTIGAALVRQDGLAQVVVNTFAIGFHVGSCTYSGDSGFAPSASQATFSIGPGNVGVSVTANRNPSPVGSPVDLTVVVMVPDGVPTGLVSIFDGSTLLVTLTLQGDGYALYEIMNPSPGTHTITATYAGDMNFSPAQTATPLVLIIGKNPTQTTIATSASQVNFGQPVTVTVGVASSAGVPTGTVTLTENNTTIGTGALTAGQAKITLSGLTPGSHSIVANYSGDANFDASSSAVLAQVVLPGPLQIVSAASGATTIAPDSLVSVIGTALVPAIIPAPGPPLLTIVGGVSLAFKDSAGTERLAALTFVGPSQINAVAPAGMAAGTANVTVRNASGDVAIGTVTVAPVAPGLFTADSAPTGVAAAIVETVHPDGTITSQDVFQCTRNVCTALPISLGPEGDRVILVLFGTGIRNAKDPVKVVIATQTLTPLYAGPQPSFPGLDHINVTLPASLRGAGNATVVVTIGAQMSNAATIRIQ